MTPPDKNVSNDHYDILEFVPVGVFIIDKQYNVLSWNQCISDWTGIEAEKIIGTEISTFFSKLKETKYTMRVEGLLNGGPPVILSSALHKGLFPSVLPTGEPRIFNTKVMAVKGLTEGEYHAMFALTDVTELDKRMKKVKEMSKEAKKANEAKTAFLSNISHELRSPLNSLLVLADILRSNSNGNLSKDEENSAKIIFKSGDALLSLINELLDLAKVESGKMSVHIEPLSFADLCEVISETFSHLAEEKGLTLTVSVDQNLPKLLRSDIKRIAQILKNLVSNAIKFTSKGGVTVTFRQVKEGDVSGPNADKTFAIDVTDTGIGIPEEKQKDIFEAFQQADSSTAKQYGGTGLGLSISVELSKLLGGRLALRSETGKGSTFTAYLSLELDPDEECIEEYEVLPKQQKAIKPTVSMEPKQPKDEATAEADFASDIVFNGEKILLVDDDMRNLYALASMLKSKGMVVLKADDFASATANVAQNPDIRLILANLLMADLNGKEFLEDISRLQRFTPPVIAMTDNRAEGEEDKCMAFGAKTHTFKPINNSHLLEYIQEFLDRTADIAKIAL